MNMQEEDAMKVFIKLIDFMITYTLTTFMMLSVITLSELTVEAMSHQTIQIDGISKQAPQTNVVGQILSIDD